MFSASCDSWYFFPPFDYGWEEEHSKQFQFDGATMARKQRRRKSKRIRRFDIEALEIRNLLAANVTVSDGDLLITGEATGDISIVDLGDGKVQVTETGAASDGSDLVQTLEGVTDDIRINLDSGNTNSDDSVSIDLSANSVVVDRIFAALGGGNNSLTFSKGSISGNLVYRGGSGNDSVTVGQDASVGKSVYVSLGAGDNSTTIDGDVTGNVVLGAKDGDDSVSIGESASIGGSVHLQLGDGDNDVENAGDIERDLNIRGGVDDDTIALLAEAIVGRTANISLGEGDNSLTVDGTIEGRLKYNGLDGNDTVSISGDAVIGKDASLRLSGGSNSVTVAGTIGGNLNVVSNNAEDTVDTDNATIVGNTNLGLGEQWDPIGRRRRSVGMC